MDELGAKTRALLQEHCGGLRKPAVPEPKLDEFYRAGDLPARSVVRGHTAESREYVIGRTGMCMAWEQPIPGSDDWRVMYAGRLEADTWMTHRERAEVDEVPSVGIRQDECQHEDGVMDEGGVLVCPTCGIPAPARQDWL